MNTHTAKATKRELAWMLAPESSGEYGFRLQLMNRRYGWRVSIDAMLLFLERLDLAAPLRDRDMAGRVDLARLVPDPDPVHYLKTASRLATTPGSNDRDTFADRFAALSSEGDFISAEVWRWRERWQKAAGEIHARQTAMARAHLVSGLYEERETDASNGLTLLHTLLRLYAFPEGESWVEKLYGCPRSPAGDER